MSLLQYWSINLLLGLMGLLVLAYLYMTRNFTYWRKLGVMAPKPTPFLGNFGDCLRMRRSPGEWLQDLHNWGAGLPYIGFYVFDQPFLLARDTELIKNILVKDFDHLQDRFAGTRPEDRLGDANLFLIKNPAWKYVRTKLTPIYTSSRLKKMFQLMVDVADDLNAHMMALPWKEDRVVIEIKELCSRYTTDLIATTAFGLKVNSLQNPEAEFRKHGRDIVSYNFFRSVEITCIFFAPEFVKKFKFNAFSSASTKFLRDVVWETFKERERLGTTRGDLIDLLIELKNTQTSGPEKELFEFNGDNVVAQAAVFFTAGYETSSTILTFILYELALHPDIQSKLRAEIMEALETSEGKIPYDTVLELPYLNMVVSEGLRKYPPLPLINRVTTQNYQIPNSKVVLKKGTPVFISILGLHYDPQNYSNPQKFDPERFNVENKKARPTGVYLPFGDGPHSCIGLRIGLLQVKLGLIELLQKFEFLPCEKTVIPMQFDPKALTISAKGGLFLKVRKIVEN